MSESGSLSLPSPRAICKTDFVATYRNFCGEARHWIERSSTTQRSRTPDHTLVTLSSVLVIKHFAKETAATHSTKMDLCGLWPVSATQPSFTMRRVDLQANLEHPQPVLLSHRLLQEDVVRDLLEELNDVKQKCNRFAPGGFRPFIPQSVLPCAATRVFRTICFRTPTKILSRSLLPISSSS